MASDDYTSTIYPDVETGYPIELCRYIAGRFYKTDWAGFKLLDIGCGKGTHLRAFRAQGIDAHGIDLRAPDAPYFHTCDVEYDDWPFEDQSFDGIYSKSLFEHIRHHDHVLKEAKRVLKPGGIAVIMTPDWRSQMRHFWDDYTHVHAFTRKSLRDALIINGFRHVDCDLFYQLPFLWKWPWLAPVCWLLSMLPDRLKWKDRDERNGKDRKLIRFSKELMLLAWGYK